MIDNQACRQIEMASNPNADINIDVDRSQTDSKEYNPDAITSIYFLALMVKYIKTFNNKLP